MDNPKKHKKNKIKKQIQYRTKEERAAEVKHILLQLTQFKYAILSNNCINFLRNILMMLRELLYLFHFPKLIEESKDYYL